jgi:hypothetical protein
MQHSNVWHSLWQEGGVLSSYAHVRALGENVENDPGVPPGPICCRSC